VIRSSYMLARLAAVALFGANLAHACECQPRPSVLDALKGADIVFRGRVTGFRGAGKGAWLVIFTVERVWKGDVPHTFEMPAKKEMADCEGFAEDFLKGGTDLLVYAFKNQGQYSVSICSRTAYAATARDFTELGPGIEPNPK